MAQVTYTKIKGKQRNRWLLWTPIEKHLYVKHRVNGNEKEEWICYQKILRKANKDAVKCTSAVQIDSNQICRQKNRRNPHTNHTNHKAIYDDLVTLNKIKNDCIAIKEVCDGLPMNISAADIFTRELAKRNLGESKLRYTSIERNLRRLKNKQYPKKPTTADEIKKSYENPQILEDFGYDLRSKNRFYIDTVEAQPGSFTLFGSFSTIEMIRQHIPTHERKYLIDGTFDATPFGSYYQLLIVYIEYKNDVFPIFYACLSGKTTELYTSLFEYIEKHVFKLEPAQFMCDFETGLRCAIKLCYPNITINGCWYHYTSRIRQRMVYEGLYGLIGEDNEASFIYRMLLNLPLLPTEYIVEGYEFIKKEARKRRLYKTFKPFFQYFENFWLPLHKRTSLSVHHLNMRTTSSIEAFNSYLNRTIRKHDNFFRFVESLKLHESRKSDELHNTINDETPSKQYERTKKQDKIREKKIGLYTTQLDEKKINYKDFLKAMATN